MQSTYGLSIASSTRSVGRLCGALCTDATTQSSAASSSSGTSTSPFERMFASTPARMRSFGYFARIASISSSCCASRPSRR